MAPQWLERGDATTSGVSDYEASDHSRRHGNLLRVGRVAEADYPKGLIRVAIEEDEESGEALLLTDWIPWLTQRAGKDRFWWAPEVGEAVVVMAPSGEISQGFAMPGAFSTDYPQIEDKETIQKTQFEDDSIIQYDREAHEYKIDLTAAQGRIVILVQEAQVEAQGDVNVTAEGNVTVTASRIDLNP